MKTRLVIQEAQLARLRALLFDRTGMEGAAFLLCGESRSPDHLGLITHEIMPIAGEDFLQRERYRLSIQSQALVRIAKLARYEGLSVVFAHSHPGGTAHFSAQDDHEEERLLPFLRERLPDRLHGTLVLNETHVAGRLYCPERMEIGKILSLGQRYTLLNEINGHPNICFFDRQVRAFGADIQHVLSQLHIGIVGLGGTGSPIAEQLYRLGVGELALFDSDHLNLSNLNRVYGSLLQDVGVSKTDMAKRRLDAVGLNTIVHSIPHSINFEATARLLRHCDIVLGCTDKELPRAILTQLSQRYCIPVIDVGVLIDSQDQRIRGVFGRVTTLQPGEACLFCRGRISPEGIRVEVLPSEERTRQAKEGYAPDLPDVAPAVIPFTSAVASAAVGELLHRLTGFMGTERESSEVLMILDSSRVRTNRFEPREDCFCSSVGEQCRGDEEPFLGMVWPTPPT